MKNEILVATDFSANSRSGIRFAMQLASQHSMPLVFIHVIEPLIPTKWNSVQAKKHMEGEINETTDRLQQFVKSVYDECQMRPGKYECVVRYGSSVDHAIIDYAVERKVGFICMSTKGAGPLRRIVGTHTSSIIKQSPVPVFAIPRNYKRSLIKDIMYASVLESIQQEFRKVRRFAEMVDAKVNVLHYEDFVKIGKPRTVFDKIAMRYSSSNVKFYLKRFNWEQSLAQQLKKAIRRFAPSIIILFTKHDRTWYERLLFSSKSADVSYDSKRPILIFPKGAV